MAQKSQVYYLIIQQPTSIQSGWFLNAISADALTSMLSVRFIFVSPLTFRTLFIFNDNLILSFVFSLSFNTRIAYSLNFHFYYVLLKLK